MGGFWLDDKNINNIVRDSLISNIKRCKQAHMTDMEIRINGKWERVQADWVKYLERRDDLSSPHPSQDKSDQQIAP